MIPSEAAIAREMQRWGLDRLPAIRRIQAREAITRQPYWWRRKAA